MSEINDLSIGRNIKPLNSKVNYLYKKYNILFDMKYFDKNTIWGYCFDVLSKWQMTLKIFEVISLT